MWVRWLFVFLVVSNTAWADDCTNLAAFASQQITGPDGVCKLVTNTTSNTLCVNTYNSAEWQSFYNNPGSATVSSCVVPGSQDYTSAGTYTFNVPAFNTLIVDVWGAGGGGGGYYGYNGYSPSAYSTSGGNSSFNANIIAYGGGRGPDYPCSSGAQPSGAGWSGGDSGTNGGTGIFRGSGGNGGNGGSGGGSGTLNCCNGNPGGFPGGGGGGFVISGSRGTCGGAGGGYTRKTYYAGQISIGAAITVVVGSHGTFGYSHPPGYDAGGDGADGRVTITWN